MIDIHNHILPAVDDGSKSIAESIEILKQAKKCGITDIIITPHYINGSTYQSDTKILKSKLEELKKESKKENIDINLYLGNEVFIEYNLLELLNNNEFTTLNDSKYLLFEFSMNNYYQGINELLFNLKSNKIVPIIAHPERYSFIQNNPLLLNDLLAHGALLQLDVGSFFGKYGSQAKKIAKLILKHNMASFIATDIHHSKDDLYEKMSILNKTYEKNNIDKLLSNNPKKVINNEDLPELDYTIINKTFFNKYK